MSSKLAKKYCASPWIEGLLGIDGSVNLCCRANRVVGNWQNDTLDKIFKEDLKSVREDVVNGIPFSQECGGCVANGTTTEIWRMFESPFVSYLTEVEQILGHKIPQLAPVKSILKLQDHDANSKAIIAQANAIISDLTQNIKNERVVKLLEKIQLIANCVDDYLSDAIEIRHVAPFRQVQMVVACNARCVQCVGLYSGSISNGAKIGNAFKKQMTLDESIKSLMKPEDMVTFQMTGSEFFFSKNWKEISAILRDNLVYFRNSTNGMILTPPNIKHIVDNDLLRYLLISVDGVKKETFEYIRERVKFDRIKEYIKYLFEYVNEKNYPMDLTFTFVIMKDNYQELELLPDFIHSFQIAGSQYPRVNILVQVLDNRGEETYLDFVEEHHHTLVPHDEFKRIVITTAKRAKELNMNMTWSYNEEIDDFIARGCPFEGFKELSRVRVHLDTHKNQEDLTAETSEYFRGWAVSKHGVKDIKVSLNEKAIDQVQYGRKCEWLKNTFSYAGVEDSGLDFFIPHHLYQSGNNIVDIVALDKKGFETKYSVFIEKN